MAWCLVLLAAPAGAHAEDLDVRPTAVLDARAGGEWTGRTPTLVDLDGDGRLDLLATNENGHHYGFDLATGAILLDVAPRRAPSDLLGPFNAARAADLDGDGRLELVAVDRDARVDVWTLAATLEGLRAKHLWTRRLDAFDESPSADAPPALGDLDGDGALDIALQTEGRGAYALRADGSTLWALEQPGGNAEAALVDIDGDGDLDALFSNDAGLTYAVDGLAGVLLWSFNARGLGVWPGSAPTRSLVVDLDGDGRKEVVACLRNVENATERYAPGAPYYREHHFVLLAFDSEGLRWKAKPTWGNPMCSAPLMAHDVDGDGAPEIYGFDWNTIGHKPGSWDRLGPAHAFSFDARGRERWHVSLDSTNSKGSAALVDWNGDGTQDLLAYARGRLVALDARTGRVTGVAGLQGWDVKQGPLVLDAATASAARVVVGVRGESDGYLVLEVPKAGLAAAPGWELPPEARRPPREPPGPPAASREAPAARVETDEGAGDAQTPARRVPGPHLAATLVALGAGAALARRFPR